LFSENPLKLPSNNIPSKASILKGKDNRRKKSSNILKTIY
jgi:hypothetical protein